MKRPVHAVRAFCDPNAEPAHLVMVGTDGNLTAEDVRRTVPSEKQPFVHVAGPRSGDDLDTAYRAAGGFVSLSFQENFGYAAAEAIARGLPVILSPGHDLAYDLPQTADGRITCGWLLPDDSVGQAAIAIVEWAAMARVLGKTTTEMGAAGRARAGEALSRERFRERLRGLL